MKKKIINSLNYDSKVNSYTYLSGVSLTVPDQAMSLRTILDRFARGLPIGVSSNVPVYGSDDPDTYDWPDPRTMDLSERQEFAQSVIKESRKQFKDGQKNKSKKEAGNDTSSIDSVGADGKADSSTSDKASS